MADLARFLAAATRTPFVWGIRDCCLWLADWVVEARGGEDPAEGLRGRYSTAIGCARLVRRRGGLLALLEAQTAQAGLPRTLGPVAGDIGLVETQTTAGRRLVGGICTGPRWAVLSQGGLLIAPLTPTVAWGVLHA